MNFYTAFSEFLSLHEKYLLGTEFKAQSYSKTFGAVKNKEIIDELNKVNGFKIAFDSFFQSMTILFRKFDNDILSNEDDKFYDRPNIHSVVKMLFSFISNNKFVQKNVKQGQIIQLIRFNNNQITELAAIYRKMYSVFEQEDLTDTLCTGIVGADGNIVDAEDEDIELLNSQESQSSQIRNMSKQFQELLKNQTMLNNTINNLLPNLINSQQSFNLSKSKNKLFNENNNVLESEYEMHKARIKNKLRTKMFKEQHLNAFNAFDTINKSNNNGRILTTDSLFYNKFPMPFLADNADFVNEYSQLITKFQTDTHKLIIKHLTSEIESIDLAIVDFKRYLTPFYEDVNSIFESIEYEINNNMTDKKELLRRNAKLQVILKYEGPTKYSVKEKISNAKQYNNVNNNNNKKISKQYNNYNSNTNNNNNKSRLSRPVFTNKSNYNNVNSSNKEIVQTNHRYHSRNKLNNNQFQNNRITQQPYANERRNQSNFSIRNRSMSKNNGRPGNHSRSRRRNANGSSVSFNQNGFQW
jgi:hypothetical protein